MQLIWVLPTLGFGLFLGLTTGNWLAGGLGLASAVALLAVAALQHFRAPVLPTDAVQFRGGRFYIGRRRLPRWELLWKLEWFDRCYDHCAQLVQRTAAARLATQMLAGELATNQAVPASLFAWLGFSGSQPLRIDLVADGPHALIIGPTGAGKSQLLTVLLRSLVSSLGVADLRFCLLDFKGGATLGNWFGHPSTQAAATDLDGQWSEVLTWLAEQLHIRERYLAEHSCSRFEELPRAERIPRLLVVVDELQPLLKLPGSEVIEDVTARGRSLGVHLIATAQSSLGLSRGVLANSGLRFSVGLFDPVELAQLGFRPSPEIASEIPNEKWRVCQYRGSQTKGSFVFPLGLNNSLTTV